MKLFLRSRALLLAVILLITGLAGLAEEAAEERVLTLPGAMKVIDEEAFMDAGMFDRAALPAGIKRIEARAFANSSLSAVNLPDTITFIAEDAFDGSQLTLVAAPKGTYGHDWALSHGFLKPLTLSVTLMDPENPEQPAGEGFEAGTGDTVQWSAGGAGGLGPYRYSYSLYRDETLLETAEDSIESLYAHTFVEPGEYALLAVMRDENGDIVEARSEALTVSLTLPTVIDLSSLDSSFETIRAHVWTASVHGGSAPYQYRFQLKQGSTVIYTRDYAEKDTLFYTFFDAGSYTLTVTVRDSHGQESEPVTQAFSVTASQATVEGLVRIYVDVDSSGNVIYNDNSRTGHYELQINNSADHPLAFDDRMYLNPAFSFQSGAGGIGIVAISDGDQLLRPDSALYTFSFSTTADKLKEFLYNRMLNQYLDLASADEDETWTRYNVSSGPFTQYNVSTSNCFTAVAAWSSWLGYDTLSTIANGASSYTDYIAWRMLRKYGEYWTYVGVNTDTEDDSGDNEENESDESTIEAVIALAESRLGARYIYGAGYNTVNPNGFDCSGFTYWCYYFGTNKQVILGNTAYRQGNDSRFASRRVTDWESLKRGDILCFKDDSTSNINHVGLYLGNGKFIHASASKEKVIYSYFNSGNSAGYWRRNLVWGYRVL